MLYTYCLLLLLPPPGHRSSSCVSAIGHDMSFLRHSWQIVWAEPNPPHLQPRSGSVDRHLHLFLTSVAKIGQRRLRRGTPPALVRLQDFAHLRDALQDILHQNALRLPVMRRRLLVVSKRLGPIKNTHTYIYTVDIRTHPRFSRCSRLPCVHCFFRSWLDQGAKMAVNVSLSLLFWCCC